MRQWGSGAMRQYEERSGQRSFLRLARVVRRAHVFRIAPLPHCLIASLLIVASAQLSAHDIPVDILVQIFLKPEGSKLTLVVRVPLSAMRDVDFPLHGQGYLDLPQPEAKLREAAELWIGNE